MPCGKTIKAKFPRRLIEIITLNFSTHRTNRTLKGSFYRRNSKTFLRHFLNHKRKSMLFTKALTNLTCLNRRLPNRKINVKACDIIAKFGKHKHKNKRILTARKSNKYLIPFRNKIKLLNPLLNLLLKKHQETLFTKSKVMGRQINNSHFFTSTTLHTIPQIFYKHNSLHCAHYRDFFRASQRIPLAQSS